MKKIINIIFGAMIGSMIGFLVSEGKILITDTSFLDPDVLVLTILSGAIAGIVVTTIK